jgi:hypothetical protein
LSHFFEHATVIRLEFLFSQPLIQRFLALGAECLEFETAADESKAKLSASNKALEEAKTCLAAAEAKRI